MKKLILSILVILAACPAYAAAKVGKTAPDFTATSESGRTVKLSQYKGKPVVLEWTNPGCPFVKKFYDSGAMQKLQADTRAKGVVWLSVNSSAKDNQGHVDEKSAKTVVREIKSLADEYLLDSAGTIGHLYGAKSTPHMFVIDKTGKLVYAGAIDDKPTADPKDIAKAHNYVTAAVDEILAEKPVTVRTTQAYGCNVKY
jgi:peroxiredoxin